MDNGITSRQSPNSQEAVILVAVDFSDCSRLALRKAQLLLDEGPGCIIALHVIDYNFIAACLRRDIADDGNLKSNFL